MGNIAEDIQFPGTVNQIEDNDDLDGGADGNLNKAAKALADRTQYLKAKTDGNHSLDDSLALAGTPAPIDTLFGRIGRILKAITGKANWYTPPAITLEAASQHTQATNNPHNVTLAQVGGAAAAHGHVNDVNIGGPYAKSVVGPTNIVDVSNYWGNGTWTQVVLPDAYKGAKLVLLRTIAAQGTIWVGKANYGAPPGINPFDWSWYQYLAARGGNNIIAAADVIVPIAGGNSIYWYFQNDGGAASVKIQVVGAIF